MAKINFTTLQSLKPVSSVIQDAFSALANPVAGLKDSSIPKVLKNALEVKTSSFAGLYGLGNIGATGVAMMVGTSILVGPLLGMGLTKMFLDRREKNRLAQEKERMLQDAIRARDAIVQELSQKVEQSEDRIARLTALNTLLQQAVKEMQDDLATK